MNDLLSVSFLSALVSGGILAGMPVLFASLGETISERAGVLNIGLEGMMLAGGYAGFVAALYSEQHWLGLAASVGAGALIGVIVAWCCVGLRMDQIVVGIAVLILAEGVTSVLQRAQFGTTYPRLEQVAIVKIPLLSSIPVLGSSLFTQPLVVYIGFAMIGVLHWLLKSTYIGLNLRAAGEKPEAVDAAGISVVAIRAVAVLVTGGLAGLGGGYMAIVGAGIFVPFMTKGAGFIAIVVAMLARGRAVWVLIGSLLFGMSVSLTTSLQLIGVEVAQDVVNMIPFVAVMIALVAFARGAYLPAALAIPYHREAR
ncbi:MAG: ABC transporter permease [Deltaproteobacteria bacterium]|nr:ABC transporter permease [Deltaproteobacteria bacterium]MBW2120608.1 ABC transporter permease [Deltaproteobacteria bacterium]